MGFVWQAPDSDVILNGFGVAGSTRVRFEWVWRGRHSTRMRFEWFGVAQAQYSDET